MKTFEKRLLLAMKDKNITQVKLSEKTGIPACMISLFVCGKRKPNLDNLIKLCDGLDTTPNYLLGFSNSNSFVTTVNNRFFKEVYKSNPKIVNRINELLEEINGVDKN